MTPFAVLLPAAGASSRMRGGDKLLEDVAGQPCLRVMAARALAVTPMVIVTLPDPDHPRATALDGLPVKRVIVTDAHLGMSRSLVAGAAAVLSGHALMVLPADMPGITADSLAALVQAQDGRAVLRGAAADGRPGHPILFPAWLLPRFALLTGDRGAAPILTQPDVTTRLIALPGDQAVLDLDTPEDWAAFRARS